MTNSYFLGSLSHYGYSLHFADGETETLKCYMTFPLNATDNR